MIDLLYTHEPGMSVWEYNYAGCSLRSACDMQLFSSHDVQCPVYILKCPRLIRISAFLLTMMPTGIQPSL